jgi:ubiquinone/menaquinone biosynthesis C-methylase UbiE
VYDTRAVQKLVYRPAQDLVLDELRRAGVRSVLDVGCGTGIFATRVRSELDADVVCGCDLSEGMLEQAAAKTRDVGWIRSDATRLPLGDGSIDAIVCTEAFHFFDQPAALAEFRRVLRAGGIACVALINPRTDVGSELLHAQASALGAGTWPTRRRMRKLVEAAGLEVRSQHRVRRIFGYLLPTVLTVAVRPAA